MGPPVSCSRTPPTGRTLPRSVISPVIATSLPDRPPRKHRRQNCRHRNPRGRAVLRYGSRRRMDVHVLLHVEPLRTGPGSPIGSARRSSRPGRTPASRRPHGRSNSDSRPPGNQRGLHEHHVAARGRHSQSRRYAHLIIVLRDFVLELPRPQVFVQVPGLDADLSLPALREPARNLAAERSHRPLEVSQPPPRKV